MPQNKNDPGIIDGWYKNITDRPVSLCVLTLAPGQARFVPAARRLESRYTGLRFKEALDAKRILGPRTQATDFETPVVKKKTRAPKAAVVVTEPVKIVDEVKAVEPEKTAPPAAVDTDIPGLD